MTGGLKVSIEHLQKPGEVGVQESDLLDRMPDGESCGDSVTDAVRLVSLGCFCGPKLSFKKIGRGAETLPFDWVRTRLDGVLNFMRSDFAGFYDFVTRQHVPNTGYMIMYRNYYHSFWHDNPTEPAMRERYDRRITRFGKIDAHNAAVLFVRTVVTSDELSRAPELLAELVSRFGKLAKLLLIIDFQTTAPGAAIVEGYNSLLLYLLGEEVHDKGDAAPYCEPVTCALNWAVGRSIAARTFPSIEKAVACTDTTHWGLMGMGGLMAFEDNPDSDRMCDAGKALAWTWWPPAIGCERLDAREQWDQSQTAGTITPAVTSDKLVLVSLGCNCAIKLALQSMGYGNLPLPFDWLCSSLDGVVSLLSRAFADLFEYTTRGRYGQEMELFFYRASSHSFWHDNPDCEDTKKKYKQRISNFYTLVQARSSSPAVLFVRAISTTDELVHASKLLYVLRALLQDRACLLLIANFQSKSAGAYMLDGYDDLLIFFSENGLGDDSSPTEVYRQPIEEAIQWLLGKEMQVSMIPTIDSLGVLVDETHWGLQGLGGFDAFEARDRTG